MIEYTFYYKGKFYIVNANCVDLARKTARQRFGAQFDRESMLTNSRPTTAAAIAKAVGTL